MSDPVIPIHSLVLFKGKPARVLDVGDKLEISIKDKAIKRVRPKDVELLHAGPVTDLGGLDRALGDVAETWELLQGEITTVSELAELHFNEATPAAVWSAWQIVSAGIYFEGTPTAVSPRDAGEVRRTLHEQAEQARREAAWEAFMQRLAAGRIEPGDEGFLLDVEQLADGRGRHSNVLAALGKSQSPETAHALLLKIGHWDDGVNPYPYREGLVKTDPELPLPPAREPQRTDLTHLPAYAIDDADSHDPDDAISFDGERLWVHVADVATLVEADGELDRLARERGSNLYLPERTVHMLPPAVTSSLALGLKQTSPALSVGILLADDGSIEDARIVLSRIRATRLSYEQADQRLDEEPFKTLRSITQRFQARRREAGAACIELPEVKIKVVDGQVEIHPMPRLASRRLVMEAMLMAGEAVGRYAREHCVPIHYATQAPPEKTMEPVTMAEMYAYRKCMRRSQMRISAEPHAGLGLEIYTQITSPLRRYLDLVVHQQLHAHLAGEPLLSVESVLERMGGVESPVRAVRRAEQQSNRHWTLIYLKRRPDWRGEAVLVDQSGRKGTLLLPELGMEARVTLDQSYASDVRLRVALQAIDLPNLGAHFRIEGPLSQAD